MQVSNIAEIAKEITVAMCSSSTASINANTGKSVGAFYTEVFNAISQVIENAETEQK